MTGLLIVARLGSTRLTQKHLIKVGNKMLIEHLVDRVAYGMTQKFSKDEFVIIIATADEPANRKFEEIPFEYPVSIYYGDIHNIPLRQLECAMDMKLDNIISIDGDDILVSPKAIENVFEEIHKGEIYIKTEGLPLGMNVMGYSTEFLQESIGTSSQSVLETGWGRIFNGEKLKVLQLGNYESDVRLRFTLDYQEDADFFTTVINHYHSGIKKVTDAEIIDFVISNEVFKINGFLNETYWNNFNNQVNNENK